MKRKTPIDILKVIGQFQKNVLENKPSVNQMLLDIRMMQFKIKPLQGDVSQLNFYNKRLIEILWSLGKLDEFFQSTFKTVAFKERQIFFNYFDSLHRKFQDQLNRLDLKQGRISGSGSRVLEMEIFKEHFHKKKLN